jgi:F-type H+-transporting ATPase subunit c
MEYEAFKYIGVGLLALGMMGAAIGVGNIFAAYVSGIARNPSAQSKMFTPALSGAGMAEAMGLFALVLAFMII